MDHKQSFKRIYPNVIFLENEVSSELETFLKEKKWIGEDENIVSAEKPGDGNMNFVLRLLTNKQSLILKQSRPWVQKYPQVSAPIERIHVEYHFYHFIAPYKNVNKYTPAVIGFDADQYLLALEDLGDGADYTYLYQKGQALSVDEIAALCGLISVLHQVSVPEGEKQGFDNQAMKELNHEHIFSFPFSIENGFDLDTVQPGLQQLSQQYKQDKTLKTQIEKLGEIYLQNHDTLLHGDYYPGSWLKVKQKLKLIDPEFSYFGKAEFDLGVMLAHLKMSQQEEAAITTVLDYYQQAPGFDVNLMWAFAGVEILRRLIGLAQLPLSLSLEEKKVLMQEAASFIRQYEL
ncbi:phosphotransferase [Porifericola rhodea]|uniref:phosphotransferase n=1 Tax=Porifericola rhodea TaxID=930972 RepID=UPI002666BD0E|nr:phosphotransferase [Porifericola rhodea]WKN33566.1 phosphotransferase [Porifericola rhodea]